MERQKSFSFKSTRLFVFSFTVGSSLLVCFFFFYSFTDPPLATREIFPRISARGSELQNITSFASKIPVREVKNGGLALPRVNESANLERSNQSGVSNIKVNATDAEILALVRTHEEVSANRSTEGVDSVVREVTVKRNKSEVLIGKIEENMSNEAQSSNLTTKPSNPSANISWEFKKPVADRSRCDLSKGRWVFYESYPLYSSSSCPFIDEGFSCQTNGRLNRDYMKWSWHPQDCNIPRFNPVKMLELIRGKRLVFVGDSLNRNQWESMLCLLIGAVKDPSRVYEAHGRKITKTRGNYNFKFVDYKCSVEFYVSHYLVHEGKARIGKKKVQTLRIDTIDKGSSKWRSADILVFNTAHWWSHYKTKAGVNYYQEGDLVHHHLDVSIAFKRALTTWASWVDQHINPRKTRVFFRNSSPSHFSGGQWNAGGHCGEATRPLNDTSHWSYPEKNIVEEEVIEKMKIPVTILNVTGLSEFRIDGHPSLYGRKPERGSSTGIQDCSHWCLPGVPDTWNELLYFHLLIQGKTTPIV
ncbi:protein trichome birefringence-like 6 isoform X2 [Aristolochia californica]|uniref:protein trichome birefringence-like 6 isoform X2 n=1 Tax=Aristolochia californica TaxID=171875 RepID=UPI0035D60DBD